MASTYSNLKIQLMATGENSATWGNVTNTNLGTALEEAIAGSTDVAFSSANVTLTLTDTNASQSARHMRLNLTGTATAGYNLIVPAIEKAYIVNNATDGTITVKNATGTGIAVPTGKTLWVFNDGTNVKDVVTHLTSLTLATVLPVASGGTGGNTAATARSALGAAASGANTDITSLNGIVTPLSVGQGGTGANTAANARTSLSAAASGANSDITSLAGLTTALSIAQGGTGANTAALARTSLGATTVGGNVFTLTNPSAITFPRFNADNTVSALDAATFRTAIGAGTSSTTGTVTSVAMSVPAFLSIAGSPITGSGTLAVTLSGTALPIANGGTGSTATAYCNLTTNVTGTLPLTNGGTGATDAAGARTNIGATTVGGNMFTLANPSAITFLQINANNTVSALDAASFRTAIGAGAGGGSVTSVSFTGGIISVATATTTPALTVAGTSGGIPYFSSATTWATSAALAANALVVGGGAGAAPATVTTGTGVVTALGVNTGTAGAFVVNGGALGTPSSGTLTNCTFPTLNQSTTGSAGSVANAVTFNNGGAGAASGTTYNGSAAQTISYNTVGAYAATNPSGYTSNVGTVTSVGGTGSTNGLTLSGTVTSSGNITLGGSVTSVASGATIDSIVIGYRNIPRSTTTTTATTGDVGKCIAVSAGITIPNSTFAAGDAVSIYNDSASAVTITAGVTTLRLAGTTTTGNRTLAPRGMATVWFNSATEAIISGAGVT